MSKPLVQQVTERARGLVADPRSWTQYAIARTGNNRHCEPTDAKAARFCAYGAILTGCLRRCRNRRPGSAARRPDGHADHGPGQPLHRLRRADRDQRRASRIGAQGCAGFASTRRWSRSELPSTAPHIFASMPATTAAALVLGAAAVYVGTSNLRQSAAARSATSNRASSIMSEPMRPNNPDATHDVLKAARSWIDKDGRVALATVVGTWGSAPVGVGGQMVVARRRAFRGIGLGRLRGRRGYRRGRGHPGGRQTQDAYVRRRR